MLRTSWLLALCALFALSSAFNLGDLDGVHEYLLHGQHRRQASGTGNSPSGPASSATPPPQTSSAAPPASSPQPTPTPTPSPNQPSSNNPPASSAPATSRQNSPTQRSSAPAPTSADAPSSRTTPIIRTSPLVSTSQQLFTFVTVSVDANGSSREITATGTSSIPITTGELRVTGAPVGQPTGSSSDGGLSDTNKKVIGGVVGGVGGALLLGGIALVFWRMKKRQHKVTADDDDLNLNTGAALGDKSNNTGATPFQSNLEQYHNPGGRPNAAANF